SRGRSRGRDPRDRSRNSCSTPRTTADSPRRTVLVPRRRGFDRLRSPRRTRTRLLATRVWVHRSSVDRRIENGWWRHLHDPPTIDHPAVQSISRRDPARAAALRVAVLAGPDGPTGQIHCGKLLADLDAAGGVDRGAGGKLVRGED